MTNPPEDCDGQIFRDILQEIHLGLVILDIKKETVTYFNQQASEILNLIKLTPDFDIFYPVIESSVTELLDSGTSKK